MERILILVVLGGLAVAVAAIVQRRSKVDPPTDDARHTVPTQLDRADFARPEAPWLVAVFSSDTCLACAGSVAKAEALASDAVAVQDLEATRDKAVHERYGIDAVPLIVIADAEGVVVSSFVGEPTATDLWAAVAEAREPGSTPQACKKDHAEP